jgi:hypothetical protein
MMGEQDWLTGETEIVTGVSPLAGLSALAWSAADDEADQPERRSWWDTSRLAALTLIGTGMTGALIWIAGEAVWQPASVTTPATPTAQPTVTPAAPTTSTVTQTVAAAPPSAALPTTPGPDERFAAVMRGQPPVLTAQVARGVCEMLAVGGSFTIESETRTIAMNTGVTPEQAAYFVEEAADIYCPQYRHPY